MGFIVVARRAEVLLGGVDVADLISYCLIDEVIDFVKHEKEIRFHGW